MGHVGASNRTVYCASKHALEGMTKALSWELGQKNIRVNTICPGPVKSELTDGAERMAPGFYERAASVT